MEFPSVGIKCANPDCKQLDFLPIECECKQTFCSEHFTIHVEECRVDNKVQELKKIEAYDCSHAGCQARNIVPITCEKCGKHFCITHRHITYCEPPSAEERNAAIEKMKAPILEFQKQKEIVEQQLDATLANVKKRQKNVATANKVQLMRIKNKATGLKNIPSTDRLYFNIHRPSSKETPVPIYVSKKWSVGRAIDAIADVCKIKNLNNQQNALQLRLFKKDTRAIVSGDLSEILDTLLDTAVIIDGEDIILEYVEDNCVKI